MFEKCQQFWGPERSRRVLEKSGRIAMFWVVPKEYHLAVWGYHLSWLWHDSGSQLWKTDASASDCFRTPVPYPWGAERQRQFAIGGLYETSWKGVKGGGWHMLAQQTMSLHWIISCRRQSERVKSRPPMWHIKCLPSKWWRDGLTNRHLLFFEIPRWSWTAFVLLFGIFKNCQNWDHRMQKIVFCR